MKEKTLVDDALKKQNLPCLIKIWDWAEQTVLKIVQKMWQSKKKCQRTLVYDEQNLNFLTNLISKW